MKTHTIPTKVKAQVDRMYDGADKERVIKALEMGKTVYSGRVKLRGVKVDKADTTAPATPPAATSEPKKPGKEKGNT